MPGIPLMSCRIAGIELDSSLIFCLGSHPIPGIKVEGVSEGGVGLTESLVQRQSFGCRRFGLSERFPRREDPIFPISRQCVGISQARISRSVSLIRLNRVGEILDRRLQAVSGSLIQEIPALEV